MIASFKRHNIEQGKTYITAVANINHDLDVAAFFIRGVLSSFLAFYKNS